VYSASRIHADVDKANLNKLFTMTFWRLYLYAAHRNRTV
jgi:hypothetical protein